jgi:hypothetical protein
LAVALVHLACITSLRAEEPNFIISEWSPAIQMIRLDAFSTWPGVSGAIPVSAAFASGRIHLVFPEAIVSLTDSGTADERSLLTLFATLSSPRGEDPWSPSAGIVSSEGLWKSWSPDGPELRVRNLVTGRVERKPWNGPPVESLHALPDGRLLAVSAGEVYLAEENDEAVLLAESLPPFSMAAVSASESKIAWGDPSSEGIRFTDGSGRTWERKISGSPYPAGTPWGMAWADSMLVTAWPGKLIAVYGGPEDAEDAERVFILEDERLPNRWYRLYGGEGRLMVHSPESGAVAVLGTADKGLGFDIPSGHPDSETQGTQSAEAETAAPIPSFLEAVAEYALSAEEMMEEEDGARSAVRFCTWILPFVREIRSDRPMDPLWPELESELTRRRAALMELRE